MLASHFRNSAILALTAAVIVAGHLLPSFNTSEIQDGIRNSLHVIVFAGFAGFVFNRLQKLRPWAAFGATTLLVCVVAGSAEVLQYAQGMSLEVDVEDLLRDISGAALAIVATILWRRSGSGVISLRQKFILRALSIITGTLVLIPLTFWLTVFIINRATFPTLLTFEKWWESYTFRGINTTVIANNEATFTPNRTYRSGLSIRPLVSNWEDYTYLVFTAAVAQGKNTKLAVRVNDSSTLGWISRDAMYEINIANSPETFRIPLEELAIISKQESAKLSDVTQIVILTARSRTYSTIVLDEIRLE